MSSPPLEGSPIPKALAEAWQKSMPSDAEDARAYARFLARRAPRGLPARLVVLWLVTGMLLGAGTLYASGAVPGGLFRSPSPPSTSRVAPVSGRGAALTAPARGDERRRISARDSSAGKLSPPWRHTAWTCAGGSDDRKLGARRAGASRQRLASEQRSVAQALSSRERGRTRGRQARSRSSADAPGPR